MISQEYWLGAIAVILLATAVVVLLFCFYLTQQTKRQAKRGSGDADSEVADHVVIRLKCGSDSTLNDTVTVHTVKVEVHSSSSGAGSDENLSTSDLSERGSGAGGEHDYEDIYLVREEAAGKARSRSRDSGSHSRSASVSSSSSNVVVQLTTNSPDSNNNNSNKNNNNNNNSSNNKNKNSLRENDDSNVSAESGVSSASPSDLGNSEEETEKTRHRVSHRNSLPVNHSPNSRALKRAVSEPGACAPPPPPPPPEDLSLPPTLEAARKASQQSSSRSSCNGDDVSIEEVSAVPDTAVNTTTNSSITASSTTTGTNSVTATSTTTITKPDTPSVHRSPSIASGSSSSCAAVVECGPEEQQQQQTPATTHVGPNLVNKQMVLPFIPPKFPNNVTNSNGLIKPSEYLRSINSGSKTIPASALAQSCSAQHSVTDHNKVEGETKSATIGNSSSNCGTATTTLGPPPPPLPALSATAPHQQDTSPMHDSPPSPTAARRLEQPLATISIQDLNSVQLRRTKVLSKTMSAPPRSIIAVNGDQPYHAQKQDLIEELKMSKDIPGIKKLKVERVKLEEQQEKEIVSEIARQLSANTFVDKVPEKDATGNPIPPWKRQMLAKKAAEKARKELEESLARQAEEKRLQSIPAWKRQLMQSKKPDEKSMYITAPPPPPPTTIILEEKRHTVVTPAVTAAVTASVVIPATKDNNKENNKPTVVINKEVCTNGEREIIRLEEEETTQIIPWRAQLRKTNSTLNLLE